ncbi:MAG: hypothetical protein ACRDZ3_06900 [Acidimicrobiia bacterium]
MTTTAAQLLREGRLERVPVDVAGAWERIDEAERHLRSSASLASSDESIAYVALYDAAGKAVTAHMLAHGYRATNRVDAHQAVVLYAEATLAQGTAAPSVTAFDRMRRLRNRSEYGHQVIGAQVLAADLVHARAIVAAVETDLPPRAS